MGKSKVNLYAVSRSAKQTERIESALKLLGFEGICSSYGKLADEALRSDSTPLDFLETLLEHELTWKEAGRSNRWLQQARFPWKKTLEEFDFPWQPTINKKQIYDLASCRFIDNAENIVFFGPPGVGKTHLSIAIGMEAIAKGYEVRFLTLHQLIDLIEKARERENLQRLFISLLRPRLLILDEMDFYETNSTVSTFLFKLLHERYEKNSIILTSNKTFVEWEKVFGSRDRAGRSVDRILHHSTVISIEGDSYRMKDKLLNKAIGLPL